MAALYSWHGTWILFDRFSVHEEATTRTETVVVISAPTLDVQLAAGSLIMTTQPSLEDVWLNAGDGD